ncbi:MAG: flagellar hook-basal body complex protein FliE [Peptococcaceae bacterium]|jgi:flagellar hook-basal body complex protein FliE|nr:flagellar hook-basal body complex protein FliE [Peptococcaceae bacterium]MDH7524031.1 flagellar hook-basal body complex protein FliE [Peptococcaceae bacterium]
MEIQKSLQLNPKAGTFLRPAEGPNSKGFGEILREALNRVNEELTGAEKMSQDFALGKDIELHQVVLATERASLALQLTIQIRNKIIESYQEIMRMQV